MFTDNENDALADVVPAAKGQFTAVLLHVVRLRKTSFQAVTKCNGFSVTLSYSHFELWGETFSTGLPSRVVEGTNYYDNQCRSDDSFATIRPCRDVATYWVRKKL